MRRRFVLLAFCAVGIFGCALAENAVDRTTIEVRDTELFLWGEITSQSPRNFQAALDANPQLRTVVLMEMPGSLDDEAMLDMGYALRARGLATRLTAQSAIYSGAVDLFLAGRERSMVPGAVIGVHAWADGFGEATDYPPDAPEHQASAAYVRDMLGSDAFYWFTLQAAPSTEIHEMTPAEIARFGLLTK